MMLFRKCNSLLFTAVTALAIGVLCQSDRQVSFAQEEPPAAAQAEPAPADDAAAPANAPAPDGGKKAAPQKKSTFWWFIRSSGLIGLFIFGLSIYFVATLIRLFIELRPVVAAPPDVIQQCETLLEQRDFKGVYDYTHADDSFYSRVVSAGISELHGGIAEAREIMDRQAEAETVDMERKISMLAVLGTLGPMIGLIGTLKGMIASFAVIALSDTQLKSSEVAEGISEALLLTFEGVALAVPAIYFFALFRNRVSHITVETMLAADEFIRRFAQAARNKTAGPAAVAAAVTAGPSTSASTSAQAKAAAATTTASQPATAVAKSPTKT